MLAVPELLARRVFAYHRRRGSPKSGSDWRDIVELLITHPELKSAEGAVAERIHALAPEPEILGTWHKFVALDLRRDDEDENAGT